MVLNHNDIPYVMANKDLDRENDEKTSAVHFGRFEFNAAMCAAIKADLSCSMRS